MDKKLEPLLLTGTPRERGRIHGDALKSQINEMMEVNRYEIKILLSNTTFDNFVDTFFQETKYVPAVKSWTPELYEEVEGIADSTGIDWKLIFMHQCGDEIVRYFQSKGINFTPPASCTTIGCNRTPALPAMQGQNLDTSLGSRGFETLLHIKEHRSQLESYVLGRSGQIGYFGLNNTPLALNLNTIDCNYRYDALPLAFICRKILQLTTLEDCVEFLCKIKHAVGQNFMIGDKTRIIDYEGSANQVVPFIPYDNYRYIYHSNHPLVNTDIIEGSKASKNTLTRFEFLEIRMKDTMTPIDVENMKLILSSHYGQICAHYPETHGFTTQTWISNIAVLADVPELYVAVGNPCKSTYYRYIFG